MRAGKGTDGSIASRFLEPACGNGNFLAEVLIRKLGVCKRKYKKKDYGLNSLLALSSLYGIDILADNAAECRSRLFNIWAENYTAVCGKACRKSVFSAAESILKNNIVCGNALNFNYVDLDGKDTGKRIVFYKYKEDKNGKIVAKRKDNDNPLILTDIKFSVIISNPPYGSPDGNTPVYQSFIRLAKRLKPGCITMIIPARWMTGLNDDFRREMINDKHITKLYDFADSEDCFSGVDIKGGVCYFLWEKDKKSRCKIYRQDFTGVTCSKRYLTEEGEDIFIRYPQLIPVLRKVKEFKEQSFESIVSARSPYGLASDFFADTNKYGLPELSNRPTDGGYCIYGLEKHKTRVKKYAPCGYPLPKTGNADKYKIFISVSYGCDEIGKGYSTQVIAVPFIGLPSELCTETYLEIGGWDTLAEAKNALSYVKTKFFRCLVGIRKQSQHAAKNVYRYVPLQDFSRPWTDEELYKKYNLTDKEIKFIDKVVKEMK